MQLTNRVLKIGAFKEQFIKQENRVSQKFIHTSILHVNQITWFSSELHEHINMIDGEPNQSQMTT